MAIEIEQTIGTEPTWEKELGLFNELEVKLPETAEHSERIGELAATMFIVDERSGRSILDTLYRNEPSYDPNFPLTAQRLFWAGALHDIGKIDVHETDNTIIDKPDKLTKDEYETIKQHPRWGYERATAAGVTDPFILSAIATHHENFAKDDGYPDGIQGYAIPVAGRLIHLLDWVDMNYIGRKVVKVPHNRNWQWVIHNVWAKEDLFGPHVLRLFSRREVQEEIKKIYDVKTEGDDIGFSDLQNRDVPQVIDLDKVDLP